MSVAQELYEGIELGDSGTTGLITYMRTDSLNVSKQAQDQAREFITKRYGAGFLPEQPPVYKTKAKGAQEAHEAIRPTAVARDPEGVKEYLTRDQYRLYQLIWQRFVASQMEAALYDTLTVDVAAPNSHPCLHLPSQWRNVTLSRFLGGVRRSCR
jgi:DNA topoisomerase-1